MGTVPALLPTPAKSSHVAMIAGLPCSVTYFAADLCRDMLSRKHGSCEVLLLNDLGEETLAKIGAAEHPVVFLSELPDAQVAAAVAQTDFPIILVDQRFSEACRDFIAVRDAKPLDTVRTMARAQIGVNALLQIPRSELISATSETFDFAMKLAAICGVDSVICRTALDERKLPHALNDALSMLFPRRSVLSDSDEVSFLEELDPFYNSGSQPKHIIWSMPIELMIEAVPPHLPASNTFELIGPARCLTIGPYLYLPQGRWKAVVTFSSTSNRSTNTIAFDVTADQEIKLDQEFSIAIDGKFSVEAEFDIEDAYYPFEFRTHLRRGALEGELVLHSLVLEKLQVAVLQKKSPTATIEFGRASVS